MLKVAGVLAMHRFTTPKFPNGRGVWFRSDADSVPVVTQNLQHSEERLLTRKVDMFQQMMERMQQRNTYHPTRRGKFWGAPHERRTRETGCKVCNELSHTNYSHCMSERLLFAYLSPGHTKLNCSVNNSSQPQSGGNK
ncbi:hypothetical protein ATANTOWER_027151 [Ataeniobius toweri]|uniref:Uncharacterized protein n=1 Tax=Ataeniobius toweri TaxID=208326 RepID=A0ABU7AZT0_9TELE|nr:hypothetical protein [Ataeniobius toweri]